MKYQPKNSPKTLDDLKNQLDTFRNNNQLRLYHDLVYIAPANDLEHWADLVAHPQGYGWLIEHCVETIAFTELEWAPIIVAADDPKLELILSTCIDVE